MSTIMIGVGEYGASRTPGDAVKTMALGSCVSVVLLDPVTRCVGMVHIALPDSSLNPEKKLERPGYFADTGIPALIKNMVALGASGDLKKLYIKLAGGANVLGANITFDIGKRNLLAIKKILWTYGAGPVSEDVGGHISRTVSVEVDTGAVRLFSPGKGEWTI